MSIDDERELRLRLDSVLEAITPSPAPVPATLRRGKTIRIRRRVGVAAGLAAAIGIGLAAPGIVHQIVRQAPVAPTQPIVTAYQPGLHSSRGLIGWGTINGRRWKVSLDTSLSRGSGTCLDVVQTNGLREAPSCAPPANLTQDPSPAILLELSMNDGVSYEYGVVQPNVARVVIALSDDAMLTLRPYRLYGQRWVAFAVPTDLAIERATAYSTRSELGHAVPYGYEFVTWLRPGERGLTRATYVIGSGVAHGVAWSVVLHVGPWGYCFSIGTCTAPQDRTATFGTYTAYASGGAWTTVDEAPLPAAYVVGTLSDGGTIRARAVDVGGPRFWAWVVPQGQRLRRVAFYAASGHQIAVQSGTEYNP